MSNFSKNLIKRKINVTVLFVSMLLLVFAGCGKKKENPNAKFVGTYETQDTWGSSKSEIGSGSLEYQMTITASGEDGVILNNVNKTLDGVKGTVKGDSLIIEKQTAKSKAGKTYRVDNVVGVLSNNTLTMDFGYDDLEYGEAIGYIFASVKGVKPETKKE